MAHIVTCVYCKLKFDRDKQPFAQISKQRYAHIVCQQRAKADEDKRERDKKLLEEYINNLFKTDQLTPRIRSQIKEYVENYKYTYNGILHSLKYWYEVKNNDLDKANGAIGIVPYIYKQAADYYITLWKAAEINKEKDFSEFIPQVREIRIPVPKRNILHKKKFTFLDEEETIDEQ